MSRPPSIHWREALDAAARSLWAHRLRSMLTSLGIIIGVASVVIVVQLTKSLEARIMADVNRQGSHTFFLSPWVAPSVWLKGAKVRFQPLAREQIGELRELVPEILIASPEAYVFAPNAVAKANGASLRMLLRMVDENGLELANLDLQAGRDFTVTDRTTRAPVAILGERIAQELGFSPASIGKTFTIGGQTAELIGILKRQGEVPFMPRQDEEAALFGPDGQVFIPQGSFKGLYQSVHADRNTQWRLQLDPKLPLPEAEERLRLALRRVRGLRGDDVDNFDLSTNRKEVETVERLGRTLLAASAAMVSVSLLVGGIGVMNIMLVSVQERTREIGLRKALGARRRDLLAQFLIEASALCTAGGILGLALGAGLGTLLSRLVMHHVGSIPLWSLAAALLGPALVGLAFGIYPARKAARLDPIESLRYE
ncbi:MAG: ABC transporter permease [Holophaga sp.]|nr:ABC transporter permease [Holophaga sp.]